MDIYNDTDSEEETSKYKKKSNKRSENHDNKFKLNKLNANMEEFQSIVKHLWTPLNNRKVLFPSKDEIDSNPRSRSAKLRVAIKN